MPISSGASGHRVAAAKPPSSARSTPNLAQPPSQPSQPPPGRMIDAPPKVESRRRPLGSSQTSLYGSRPPWATEEDSPQPPFYPAGADLPHGEATRMRRMKAARQLYKSPQSRRQNTGSVDDLLRDCAISDHSHSPSPVRRAPSVASSLAHSTPDLQPQQKPNTRNAGVGTDDDEIDGDFARSSRRRRSGRSVPDLRGSARRRRRRRDEDNDGSVSGDSLDDRDQPDATAASGRQGRGRHKSRTSRGTSPPPVAPQKPSAARLRASQPLFVDTGVSPDESQQRSSFSRSKMAPGMKPTAERRYVPPPPPPPPPQAKQQPAVQAIPADFLPASQRPHNCQPADNPPFRARPMPDFNRVSPLLPVRQQRPRSRSHSPARAEAAPEDTAAATAVAPGERSNGGTSGYRSGGSSSPQRRQRRRSMDEDSLTEASSYGRVIEDHPVAVEVLQPQRSAAADRRAIAADAVDSALRNLDKPTAALLDLQQLHVLIPDGAQAQSFNSQLASLLSDESGWQYSSDLPQSLVDANQSEASSYSGQPIAGEPTPPEGQAASPYMLVASWPSQLAHGQWILPSWCHQCQKKVYPLEMLAWSDRVYHKSCFRCHVCQKQLSIGNFAVFENSLYCPAHYMERIRQHGPEISGSDTAVTINGSDAALETGHDISGHMFPSPDDPEATDLQAASSQKKQPAVSKATLQLRRVDGGSSGVDGTSTVEMNGGATGSSGETSCDSRTERPVSQELRLHDEEKQAAEPRQQQRGPEITRPAAEGSASHQQKPNRQPPDGQSPAPAGRPPVPEIDTRPVFEFRAQSYSPVSVPWRAVTTSPQQQNQSLLYQPQQNQPLQNQPQQHQLPLHQPPLHQPPLHQPPLHQQPLHQPPLHQPPLHQPPLQQPQQSQQNQRPQFKPLGHQPPQHLPIPTQTPQHQLPQLNSSQHQLPQQNSSQPQPLQRNQQPQKLQHQQLILLQNLEVESNDASYHPDCTDTVSTQDSETERSNLRRTDSTNSSYSYNSSYASGKSQLAVRIQQLVAKQQNNSVGQQAARASKLESPELAQAGAPPPEGSAVPAHPDSVARESDVVDVLPQRGTTRSLLGLWREREAAATRPPPRRDLPERSEAELPSPSAARSAFRLWRDKEAETVRGRTWTAAINYSN